MQNSSYAGASRFGRCARALLSIGLALLFLVLAAVSAQAQPAPDDPVQQALEAAREQIDAARDRMAEDDVGDAELARLRSEVQTAQSDAADAAGALEPRVADVAARLQEIGPEVEGVVEAPDIASRRADLQKVFGALDAQLKLARLLAVEGEQVDTAILGRQRAGFHASLGERTESVLDADFWEMLATELPDDIGRLGALYDELVEVAAEIPRSVWTSALLGVVGLVVLRWWLGRRLLHLTAHRVPAGRLRRSFHALAVVLLSTITPVVAWLAVRAVLRDADAAMPPDAAGELVAGILSALAFGGFVIGLGQALLSPHRPTWRLPPLPDRLARRLRWMPWLLASVLVAGWAAERTTTAVDANLSSVVVLNGIVALLLCLVFGIALWQGERVRRREAAQAGSSLAVPPWWISLLVAAAWTTVVVSLLCLAIGYVALAAFLTRQMAWVLIVLCTAYLLAVLADDGFGTLLGARGEDAGELGSRRDQAAVLLAGMARVLIGLAAITLMLAPFGGGPGELVARVDSVRHGISIGAVTLRPAAVMQAGAAFALCMLAVAVLRRWMLLRYLPTTGMDPGMRASAATLFGYAGLVVAVALAMLAAGIGLERVAWVASALSVGIGFGLQAVVQNFVSGLILLAERPVRVGDWVAIGGVEGDIRRINARATEIQMGDFSTLIVPNSEFITKTVRNVTHTNPLGVVSFKLPLPLDVDAASAREAVLAAFAANEDVLQAPTPTVFIDAIDERSLIFNAIGHVASPRTAYSVRSAVLFDVLERLRASGIALISKPVIEAVMQPATESDAGRR